MAGAYFTVVTDLGTRKMLEAINEEKKVSITQFAVGDGGGAPCVPGLGQEGLVNEVWRGEVSSCRISEDSGNLLIVDSVIPADVGGFTVREMGLFDGEGDLIAVCNTPDTQKVKVSDGIVHELALSMEMALSNTDSVQLVVDPNVVTATKKDLESLRKEMEGGTAAQVAEAIGLHKGEDVCKEDGVHGLRYYGNRLQAYDKESETWDEVKRSGAVVAIQEEAPEDTSALWVW